MIERNVTTKEIPLKQWIAEQAKHSGLSPKTIERHRLAGRYPALRVRRVNARVVLVRPPFTVPFVPSRTAQRAAWIRQEAQRAGVGVTAIYMRLARSGRSAGS